MAGLWRYSVQGDRAENKSLVLRLHSCLYFDTYHNSGCSSFHALSPPFECHIHSAKFSSPASWKKYVKDGNFRLQIVVLIIAKTTFLWCSVSLRLSAVIIIAGEVGSILSFYQLFLYQSQILFQHGLISRALLCMLKQGMCRLLNLIFYR